MYRKTIQSQDRLRGARHSWCICCVLPATTACTITPLHALLFCPASQRLFETDAPSVRLRTECCHMQDFARPARSLAAGAWSRKCFVHAHACRDLFLASSLQRELELWEIPAQGVCSTVIVDGASMAIVFTRVSHGEKDEFFYFPSPYKKDAVLRVVAFQTSVECNDTTRHPDVSLIILFLPRCSAVNAEMQRNRKWHLLPCVPYNAGSGPLQVPTSSTQYILKHMFTEFPGRPATVLNACAQRLS